MEIVGRGDNKATASPAEESGDYGKSSNSLLRRAAIFLGYGSIPFGACAAIFPTGTLILYFLTDTVRMSIGLASVVIAIPKVWDIVVDPAIGTFADRYCRRRGSRFPVLALVALALPVSAASVFLIPRVPGLGMAALAALLLIAASSFYTIYWVTHLAAAGDIGASGLAPRNSILAVRMVSQSAGGLLAGALAPILIAATFYSMSGFTLMAVSIAAVAILAMAAGAMTLRKVPTGSSVLPSTGSVGLIGAGRDLISAARESIKRPCAMGLILSNFTVMVACTYVGTSLPYVNKYLFHFSDRTLSISFTVLMSSQIVGAACGAWIVKKLGNRSGFLATSFCLLVAGLAFYPSSIRFPVLLVVLCAWGSATGGYTVLLHSSLLDSAKGDKAGAGIMGFLLGLLFAIGKLGETLGSMLTAGSLASTGGTNVLAQSVRAQWVLRAWFGAVPAALIALGIGLVILLERASRNDRNGDLDLVANFSEPK